MKKRKAITIFDEDSSLSVLKPYSDEYKGMLYVIQEDAYGEIVGILMTIDDLRLRLNVDDSEFNKILNSL